MAASELAARALVIDTNIVLDLLVFQDEKMRPLGRLFYIRAQG